MQAPPPYEYGDLSGKHGKLNATSAGSGSFVGAGQGFVSDVTLPLSGDWSVLGYMWKTAAQIRRQGVASSLGRLADVFWLAGHTGLVLSSASRWSVARSSSTKWTARAGHAPISRRVPSSAPRGAPLTPLHPATTSTAGCSSA